VDFPVECIKISWIVFAVYWLVSAFSQRAVLERPPWASQLLHRLPVWIGATLFLWPVRNRSWDVWLPWPQPASAYVGAASCVAGLVCAIWARWTLAGNWSSNVTFKRDHELIVRGPYRFVRHPIYTGLLLMSLGTAVAQTRVGGFVAVLFWFTGFWIKLREEEQLLTRHFPTEYPAYKSRVKAVIPFVL
jgi:protein-S-isoprenylcysteine O-methyltransferase Ste14